MPYRDPTPHPSGARSPAIPVAKLPRHVAVVMDGNSRWAKQWGLRRIEGYAHGEAAPLDVIHGALEIGIPYLSAYAFFIENWKRSLEEARWLMGFNREVIHRRRDELDAMGVGIRWVGRRPRLWGSVIRELEQAEQQSRRNTKLILQFCVNYGGRAEIVDAAREVARLTKAGELDPGRLSEGRFRHFLDEPGIPDVGLFLRSSDEQRISNFLLWQSAYAEFISPDRLWSNFDRRDLRGAVEQYATCERRFGTA